MKIFIRLTAFFIVSFLCPSAFADDHKGSTYKWGGYTEFLGQPGTSKHLGQADTFIPLWQDKNNLSYLNIIGAVGLESNHRSEKGFNLLVGHRILNNDNFILGAYVSYDKDFTQERNAYQQASIGLEFFSQDWDFRFSGSIPEGKELELNSQKQQNIKQIGSTKIDTQKISESVSFSNPKDSTAAVDLANREMVTFRINKNKQTIGIFRDKHTSNFSVQETTESETETALPRIEGEVGYRLPLGKLTTSGLLENVRLYGGGYYLSGGDGYDSVRGVTSRLQAEFFDLPYLGVGSRFTAGIQYQHDSINGDHVSAVARLRIPFGLFAKRFEQPTLKGLDRRMVEPIVRNRGIRLASKKDKSFKELRRYSTVNTTTRKTRKNEEGLYVTRIETPLKNWLHQDITEIITINSNAQLDAAHIKIESDPNGIYQINFQDHTADDPAYRVNLKEGIYYTYAKSRYEYSYFNPLSGSIDSFFINPTAFNTYFDINQKGLEIPANTHLNGFRLMQPAGSANFANTNTPATSGGFTAQGVGKRYVTNSSVVNGDYGAFSYGPGAELYIESSDFINNRLYSTIAKDRGYLDLRKVKIETTNGTWSSIERYGISAMNGGRVVADLSKVIVNKIMVNFYALYLEGSSTIEFTNGEISSPFTVVSMHGGSKLTLEDSTIDPFYILAELTPESKDLSPTLIVKNNTITPHNAETPMLLKFHTLFASWKCNITFEKNKFRVPLSYISQAGKLSISGGPCPSGSTFKGIGNKIFNPLTQEYDIDVDGIFMQTR